MQPHRSVPSAPPTLTLPTGVEFGLLDMRAVRVVTGTVRLAVEVVLQERRFRHHAGVLEPGDVAIGVPLDPEAPLTLIVEMGDNASVQMFEPADLRDLLAEPDGVEAAARWLSRLAGQDAPANAAPVSADEDRSSPRQHRTGDAVCGPDVTLALLRLLDGKALFAGRSDLPVTADTGVVALSRRLWIQMVEDCSVEISNPSSDGGESLIAALRNTQVLLGHTHYAAVTLEAQRIREQLRERAEWHQVLEQNTSLTLAGRPDSFVPDASAWRGGYLHWVIRAVANHLGVQTQALASDVHDLETLLEHVKLRSRRVLLAENWWRGGPEVLVAFSVHDDRPVAVLPSDRGYMLFDPQTSVLMPATADSADSLQPNAWMIYRPLPLTRGAATLRFAFHQLWPDLRILLIAGVATAVLSLVQPIAFALFVQYAIPAADRGLLTQIAIGSLVAALAVLGAQLAQVSSFTRMEVGISHLFQTAVFDRLLRLRPAFFRDFTVGDLLRRALFPWYLSQRLQLYTAQVLNAPLIALLQGMLIVAFAPEFAVLLVAPTLVIAGAAVLGAWNGRRLAAAADRRTGRLSGIVVELIGSIDRIRLACAESRAFAAWAQEYAALQKSLSDYAWYAQVTRLICSAAPSLTIAWLVWRVGTHDGDTTALVKSSVIFIAASTLYFQALLELTNHVVEAGSLMSLWKGGLPILDAEPEVSTGTAPPGKLTGRIAMEHVRFRYQEDGPWILNDITLDIAAGECVALVGQSGGGKSTLLNVMLGFEEPHSGAVLYDGQNLDGLDVGAVRSQLGVVLQSTSVLSGSILENIVGGSNCTLDEAWEAARAAGIAADIEQMPMGIYTIVSEGGTNVSGGQRQRILIARALALKPRMLIFDEATSALDNQSQRVVVETLRQLKVTRILVAHRLTTIMSADRVYVLHEGKIAEQGSPEELTRTGGLFARLFERQS